MMAAGHNHLSHEHHRDTSKPGGHVIYNVQVCATNYTEPEHSSLVTNNTMLTASQQTRQEANPVTMSICLQQPYGTFGTTTTEVPPSQQSQVSHDQWSTPSTPSSGGTGQWSGGHRLYIANDHQKNCQRQAQTGYGTFYNYFQTKFTPTANYNDNSRSSDNVKPELQQYQAAVNDQHYYGSNTGNPIHTTNYNVDDYNSIQPRVYVADTSRYTQPAYQDNQTPVFNQTGTPGANEAPSLYQHCQQSYTSPLRTTDANRLTFIDGDSRSRQSVDPSNLWTNHQYQDYARPVMSHQHHHHPGVVEGNFATQQTNNWLDKAGSRIQYQNHESTYDYYRPLPSQPPQPLDHCTSTQTYVANQTDSTRAQTIHSLPSLAPTESNYEPVEPPARLAFAVSENIELQSDGEQRPIVTSVVKRESKTTFRRNVSSVQSKKSSIVQLIKKDRECKDRRPDQGGVGATNTNNESHATQPDRLNQCRICGRHYARPSTLKTHLRTHTNERPYKCAVCCKTFSQAANLTAHQRVHTGERPFPCPICGRQFSQSSSVITHLRTHSGERPYRCNMCNRTFSDSSTLTKHCRIHSGEKPYQCEYCPMNFSQSGNLSRHLRLHSIGGSNKTQPTAASVSSSATAGAAAVVASTTTSSTNQRNHSSNPSSSPESTLSSYSISSRISSGASNSTTSSS